MKEGAISRALWEGPELKCEIRTWQERGEGQAIRLIRSKTTVIILLLHDSQQSGLFECSLGLSVSQARLLTKDCQFLCQQHPERLESVLHLGRRLATHDPAGTVQHTRILIHVQTCCSPSVYPVPFPSISSMLLDSIK
jgi:hypothetical protein